MGRPRKHADARARWRAWRARNPKQDADERPDPEALALMEQYRATLARRLNLGLVGANEIEVGTPAIGGRSASRTQIMAVLG